MPSTERLRASLRRCDCGLLVAAGAWCQRCLHEDPAYRAAADAANTTASLPAPRPAPVEPEAELW